MDRAQVGADREIGPAPRLETALWESNDAEKLPPPATLGVRAAEFLKYFSDWLDLRRVTVHAAIASSLIWLMFFFNLTWRGFLDRLGNLKGADFLQFYAAGTFARAHRIAEMYGIHQFASATSLAVPGIEGWHYLPVYPPQVALLFWPLTYTPYLTAFTIWSVANILLYVGCLGVIARLYPKIAAHRSTLLLTALAFPPFFNAVGDGQVSVLVVACVMASFCAFVRDDKYLAGAALGCTAFKPPVFLAFMIACLAVRAFRIITGMTLAAAAQLVLVLLLAGFSSLPAYIRFAIRLPRVDRLALAVKPYQMHSLRSFWMLIGTGRFEIALWLLSSLVVLAVLARYWRRESQADMRFAILIVAATLIDPHLYIYDAVMLAPALIVAIERARVLGSGVIANGIRVAVYIFFGCLFIAPLSRFTGVQLSVPVLVGLLFLMIRASKAENQPSHWRNMQRSEGFALRPI